MGKRHRMKRAFVKREFAEIDRKYKKGEILWGQIPVMHIQVMEDANFLGELDDAIGRLKREREVEHG
jgi:hypothetical protein